MNGRLDQRAALRPLVRELDTGKRADVAILGVNQGEPVSAVPVLLEVRVSQRKLGVD